MARKIQDNWLMEYLRYTDNQESPALFHMWVGLSIIATVLNREVWFEQGFYKIYPNQFIILVARSQQCRKSAAIAIGRDILESLPLVEVEKPTIIAQKITPESFIEAMWPIPTRKESATGTLIKPKSTGLLMASELSVLIDKQSRNGGLLALLVDLYDCPDKWEYRTKQRGKETLLNTYVNLLAGSAPEYLRLSLPFDEVGGGMLARTIFVYQNSPKRRIPFPEFGDEQKKSKERLVHDLLEMRKMQGAFEITAGAREWYSKWYKDIQHDLSNPALAPYYNKKETHVLKLAQLVSAARGNVMTIDEQDLKTALDILQQNEKNLPYVVGELLTSPTGHRNQQVINAIAEICSMGSPRASQSALLRKLCHTISAVELQEALDTLMAAKIVKQTMYAGKSGGEMFYELTNPPS